MPPPQNPLISVIIPTFNRLALLKETVESVRGQTFRDFEIVVVNDGSSDGTEGWLAENDDIRAINRPNGGIASARNAGVASSRGKWFAFLDHDDLWRPAKLETQARFIHENPDVGLVAVAHVRLGAIKGEGKSGRWIKGDLFKEVFSQSLIHTSTVMIRRDVFMEVGGFPTRYRFADEFHVWLKIAHEYPIALFDEPLVEIRLYDANTSHNRIGVRTDTYQILMENYDPLRVPRKVFLRTMADHDISFGRAYLGIGRVPEALSWFRRSIGRAPFRLRGYRYWLRYRVQSALRGVSRRNVVRSRDHSSHEPPPFQRLVFDTVASGVMGCSPEEIPAVTASILAEHARLLRFGGLCVKKNAPESAVTLVSIQGIRPMAVKELKPRGFLHGLKRLCRPSQGTRGFRNADRLFHEGVGVVRAPVLAISGCFPAPVTEWLLMERIPCSMEWDRYVELRFNRPWSHDEKSRFVMCFARFIGGLHARGIFHADLKTCNILVVDRDEGPCFHLMDYDDVRFYLTVSFPKRVKNLAQIFLSSPKRFGPRDRMRFLRVYGLASGLSRAEMRRTAKAVLDACRGRKILYVGFDGDIIEDWEDTSASTG